MGVLRKRPDKLSLLVPGDLEAQTGGYIYDRRVAEGLASAGWQVDVQRLDSTFPQPTPAALAHARSVLAGIPDGELAVIDGLALGGLADLLQPEMKRLRLLALVHHPLALETGLDPDAANGLRLAERASLQFVRGVIVTSRWTSQALGEYGVAADRIRVVEPGLEALPAVPDGTDDRPEELNLLCAATLTPRKGHAVLFDALSQLLDRPWHLRCAGSLRRDPETAGALRRQIERLQLQERISLLGELEAPALGREYARCHLFVLASFMEGYGMVLAEAIAYGKPIVSTLAGAIPYTVPPNAGLLVPPGDAGALAAALAKLMDDPELRRQLGANALAARETLSTWSDTSRNFARALHELIEEEENL